MTNLPVIVGFGGINAAGRSSSHQMYKRLIIDTLSDEEALESYIDLALMMGLVKYEAGSYFNQQGSVIEPSDIVKRYKGEILDNTLIRRIGTEHFDVEALSFNIPGSVIPVPDNPVTFIVDKEHVPGELPSNWFCSTSDDGQLTISVSDPFDALIRQNRAHKVQTAAQLPTGFKPGAGYRSRNHPRGLQMAIYGASDAVNSVGIPWKEVMRHVAPDQVSVYAGSLTGQLDENGFGGMLTGWLRGQELKSTQIALGLASMCTDFVSSYVLSNVGSIGSHQGACATFLYNLEHAIQDIQQGKSRVAVVGSTEAPITPETIEGFRAAGALANLDKLMDLDNLTDSAQVDHRSASRPFNKNCGFTIGESAQYVVLFDEKLVLELGATIYGAIPEVFINADGNKKSITAPGIGNYITMAKAAAATRELIGEEGLQRRSFVQAHGSSTPLNRRTESHVLNIVAQAFDIKEWPVTAVKSYLGHSLASASGDQLAATLGVWNSGWIPGIFTLDNIADDVHHSNLHLFKKHLEVGKQGMDAALINSKGFGGNNATAVVISPHKSLAMLVKRYGQKMLKQYHRRNETVRDGSATYRKSNLMGVNKSIYQFGDRVIEGHELTLTHREVKIPGYSQPIRLPKSTRYKDMI